MVKRILPNSMLKAFTAVEIDFFSKQFNKSYEEIIDTFISQYALIVYQEEGLRYLMKK